jgi:hypothetical protein
MVGASGRTVREKVFERFRTGVDRSLTRIEKLNEPADVGVPERTPAAEFQDIPGGRFPDLCAQEYGAVPPVAAKEIEAGEPARMGSSVAFVVIWRACARAAEADEKRIARRRARIRSVGFFMACRQAGGRWKRKESAKRVQS